MITTPKAGKGTGMVAKAKELAEKHGWFLGVAARREGDRAGGAVSPSALH